MKKFTRDDGRSLEVVEGFQNQILNWRPSVTAKNNWSEVDYSVAADTKLRRWQKGFSEFSRWGGSLEGAQVLEVGCGAGIDSILMSLQPVQCVTGIDLRLPLFEPGDRGERNRLLIRKVLQKFDLVGDISEILEQLPICLAAMDVTRMEFPDNSFDLLWSRASMEHIIPVERALTEMARVVRPGGLIYNRIDPYFWVRGCHRPGMVDIPWAHARLSLEEFRRFVTESEGSKKATERCGEMATLNQLTLNHWRDVIEAGPFEILEWEEEPSPFAVRLLGEHPTVCDTLLDGIEPQDLVRGNIKVWLRNKGGNAEARL